MIIEAKFLSGNRLAAALGLALLPVGLAHPEPPPFLSIHRQNTNVVVVWNFGRLQSAFNVKGPWTTLTNAASPVVLSTTTSPLFFRLE